VQASVPAGTEEVNIMVKSATQLLAAGTAALLCAVALAFTACGTGEHSTGTVALHSSTGDLQSTALPSQSMGDALGELDALARPAGVDAELWAQLKSAFADTLAARGQAKMVSAPPTGSANRVNDLSITDNGDGTFRLTWHYRNLGDYDQNGTVGVSDITPLAQHFGQTYDSEAEPNCLLAVIDSSGNGVVDIADITAIAANFGREFGGYAVERSPSSTDKYSEIALLSLADAGGDGAKCFHFVIPLARRALYRVTAKAPSGELGETCEPVELRLENGEWLMHGKDPRHTMRTPYIGPQMPEVKWTFQPESPTLRPLFSWNPVVSSGGTLYVASHGADAGFWAIGRHGQLLWRFEPADQLVPDYSAPALAADGTVYFTSTTHLYALRPDGTLIWESKLPEPCWFSSPTIAPDGTIYLCTGDGFSDTENGYLLAFDIDGTLKWDYLAGSDIVSTAAVGNDGVVISATYEGTVFALNADGSTRWELEVGESRTVWSSPAIEDDGTVYIGIRGGTLTCPHDYDNGFLYAISPNGALRWKLQTEGWISSCPAIGEDGTIYAGSISGYLYAVSPDGNLKWRFATDGAVLGNPAIGGDGTVYIAPATSSTVYAVNPDGTESWSYSVASPTLYGGNPVLAEDGLLYISLNECCYVLGDE